MSRNKNSSRNAVEDTDKSEDEACMPPTELELEQAGAVNNNVESKN